MTDHITTLDGGGTTMKMNEYQAEVRRTMEGGEGRGDLRLAIFALGVAGEAGEVADLIKKWVGHKKPRDMDALAKELGDVLWYVTALADDLGLSLRDVAQANVNKLRARYPEGFSYDRANAPRPTSTAVDVVEADADALVAMAKAEDDVEAAIEAAYASHRSARHWEERNRELVRENETLRSNSDHLSSENASLARQVESKGNAQRERDAARADAARLADALRKMIGLRSGVPTAVFSQVFDDAVQDLAAHDAGAPADGVWLTREEAAQIAGFADYVVDTDEMDQRGILWAREVRDLLRKARGGAR